MAASRDPMCDEMVMTIVGYARPFGKVHRQTLPRGNLGIARAVPML
jgi:hypothetical protein